MERWSVCAGIGMYTLLSPKSWLYAGVELGSARLQLKKSTQGPKLGADLCCEDQSFRSFGTRMVEPACCNDAMSTTLSLTLDPQMKPYVE
jgi:hypothetical protein